MENIFDDSNFNEESEMSSNTVEWGRVGDFMAGTFVKSRHGVETQYGENSIYEFFAERGSFHRITDKVPAEIPTTINKGESWSIWGRNDFFNAQANSLKPGQVVKITFVEEKKSSMGNPAKIIKIYAPKDNTGFPIMNKEWLESQDVTAGDL
jgi:hypothetical protein